MANANINPIVLTNTFNEWRVATNDLITDRNLLRNYNYVKDGGNFTVANGTVTISKAGGGTILTVANDASIGGTTTTNYAVITNGANAATVNVSSAVNAASYVTTSGVNLLSLIASAANTTRVSQNSGSTLSAKQLNFINTANVTVTVTDAGDGNANVAIFSAAGGGGGATGPSGPSGPSGPRGPQGVAGPQGPQGPSVTGPSGPSGPVGPSGSGGGVAGANVWVHRTSTYNSANVFISGSAPPSGNLKGDIWLQI